MLAIAGSLVVPILAAVGGVFLGVRIVHEDSALFGGLRKGLDLCESRLANLRGEWQAAQENMDAQLEALDTRRRRAAASASKLEAAELKAKDQLELGLPDPDAVPVERGAQIEWARRKKRELAGGR